MAVRKELPQAIYTRKQMGDACEMIVAGELTLAGIPALKVPDNWPDYDVLAQPHDGKPQRISVKSRTYKKGAAYVIYDCEDEFEWLAVVLLNCPKDSLLERHFYIIPRRVADRRSRKNAPDTKTANNRYWPISQTEKLFARYRNNFSLKK